MKTPRRINSEALRVWLDANPEKNYGTLIVKCGLSLSALDKMLKGHYPSAPKLGTRRLICEKTKLNENILFPEMK